MPSPAAHTSPGAVANERPWLSSITADKVRTFTNSNTSEGGINCTAFDAVATLARTLSAA